MTVVIGGITAVEIVEGFGEGIGDQGPYAAKKYFVDWSTRYIFANALLGLASSPGGNFVILPSPYVYPESNNMYAREITIKGVGTPTQGLKQIQYPYAIISVNFGIWQFTTGAQDDPSGANSLDPNAPYVWATQSIEFSGEMVSVPNTFAKFKTSGLLLQQSYAFPVPHAILRVKLHKVPFLPAYQILQSLNAPLNQYTYLQCSPGTLMFTGAHTERSASTDGTFTQEIDFSFAYRPIAAWDCEWNGTFWDQVLSLGGTPLLARSDLSQLIPSAYPYNPTLYEAITG